MAASPDEKATALVPDSSAARFPYSASRVGLAVRP